MQERSQMQAQLHQVQLELDAVRGALDEESAARSEVRIALLNASASLYYAGGAQTVAGEHRDRSVEEQIRR